MSSDVKPTYVDLFSGCGGLSLGFRKAGFTPLLAVDWDSSAVHCYNDNLKEGSQRGAVQSDLSAIRTHADVAAFLNHYDVHPGQCHVLAGGPPCQSFSVVGRTKVRALMESDDRLKEEWERVTASRTMLFEAYALFLEYLAPRWFLFENVPAIRSHDVYQQIISRFQRLRSPEGEPLRYIINENSYWASDYGVPQHRRRFLMVGYREDAGIPGWLSPTTQVEINVDDAISDLPAIEHGARAHRLDYGSEPRSAYQQEMRSGEIHVFNHVCRSHNHDDVALFGRMRPGARFSDPDVQSAIEDINPEHKLLKYSKTKFQDKLHKLDPTRPSWTVTAHLQKDCYKFIHPSQPRTISVREAARLQSFPDSFVFPTVLGAAFRLIGNAVPPSLAHAFAESFRASDPELGGTPVVSQPEQLQLV
jgi:DNA (cytosine-5)-methyltransferase 1